MDDACKLSSRIRIYRPMSLNRTDLPARWYPTSAEFTMLRDSPVSFAASFIDSPHAIRSRLSVNRNVSSCLMGCPFFLHTPRLRYFHRRTSVRFACAYLYTIFNSSLLKKSGFAAALMINRVSFRPPQSPTTDQRLQVPGVQSIQLSPSYEKKRSSRLPSQEAARCRSDLLR